MKPRKSAVNSLNVPTLTGWDEPIIWRTTNSAPASILGWEGRDAGEIPRLFTAQHWLTVNAKPDMGPETFLQILSDPVV
jgi:hypothetical protein